MGKQYEYDPDCMQEYGAPCMGHEVPNPETQKYHLAFFSSSGQDPEIDNWEADIEAASQEAAEAFAEEQRKLMCAFNYTLIPLAPDYIPPDGKFLSVSSSFKEEMRNKCPVCGEFCDGVAHEGCWDEGVSQGIIFIPE